MASHVFVRACCMPGKRVADPQRRADADAGGPAAVRLHPAERPAAVGVSDEQRQRRLWHYILSGWRRGLCLLLGACVACQVFSYEFGCISDACPSRSPGALHCFVTHPVAVLFYMALQALLSQPCAYGHPGTAWPCLWQGSASCDRACFHTPTPGSALSSNRRYRRWPFLRPPAVCRGPGRAGPPSLAPASMTSAPVRSSDSSTRPAPWLPLTASCPFHPNIASFNAFQSNRLATKCTKRGSCNQPVAKNPDTKQ
jgi:hypothetical protein